MPVPCCALCCVQGVVFATVGGMRGAVSLILAQTVLTAQTQTQGTSSDKITDVRAATACYCRPAGLLLPACLPACLPV